jgi:AcrR family transcriptional regulator
MAEGGGEATRLALLESAALLFDEHGYAGTSVSAVVRGAGLTSGALYFHFGGKENLALAVVEEHFASWPPIIERVLALPGTALEHVVLLSFEVARAFRDDVMVRAGSRLWTERRGINVTMPRPFIGWIETMAGMLARARAEGDIGAGVEPEPAASVLVCAFFGTHIVSDALDGREEIEDRVTQMWLHFLPALRPSRDPAEVLERAQRLTRRRLPEQAADQAPDHGPDQTSDRSEIPPRAG